MNCKKFYSPDILFSLQIQTQPGQNLVSIPLLVPQGHDLLVTTNSVRLTSQHWAVLQLLIVVATYSPQPQRNYRLPRNYSPQNCPLVIINYESSTSKFKGKKSNIQIYHSLKQWPFCIFSIYSSRVYDLSSTQQIVNLIFLKINKI